MDDIYIQYGEAGTLWDASFDRKQLKKAKVSVEGIDRISVEIDTASGEISLNAGYEPGSPQDAAEQDLFSKYKADIEAALFAFADRRLRDDPDYAAFIGRMTPASPKM